MWIGRAYSHPIAVIAGAAAVVVVTAIRPARVGVLAPALFACAVVGLFSRVTVTVDRRGLIIRYSWVGAPRTRVALDGIVGADVVDVRAWRYLGWGYRGSRMLLGTAAVVVRSGEALRITDRRGRRLSVTVDHAAGGVEVIRSLLGRAAESSGGGR
jgi:hypothetical protein